MTDNVIILGAGFSYDAGIPLLSGFIERMWDYSIRGRANGEKLKSVDQEILDSAIEIKRKLDGYHGRVSFNDRNIEDILSMLAFNVLGGGKKDQNELVSFTNAIATTIELSCDVKHPGYPEGGRKFTPITDGNEVYRRFWKSLFKRYEGSRDFPKIITFNYDLVLERSLFQVLINKYYDSFKNRLPFDHLSIDYNYKYFSSDHYKVTYTTYGNAAIGSREEGTSVESISDSSLNNLLNIEILKLHGSLNFPKDKRAYDKEYPTLTAPITTPYIIPPVSNKTSNGAINEIWRAALNSLRQAKNITFVGYSLPITDTYMQFFLKAALGPNQELNKITVFDPTLWKENDESQNMKKRFETCFSEQLRQRINFKPLFTSLDDEPAGTTKHFVSTLEDRPYEIFF